MAQTLIGMKISAVEGYDHRDGQLLIKIKVAESPFNTLMMSPEVGKVFIRAINQADAMVQRDRLGNKDMN